MDPGNVFFEIGAILGLAALLGFVGRKVRQPLLIMYLATGILAGPSGFGIIESYEQIELLAHMGVAILLFIVGLRLDANLIRTTGPVALATGLGQIVFTSAIGFLIALALDISLVSAAYVSVALTFSSTIIIVKLLSDKKEIDSLHGQIAIGFLIVQDIAAILALVGLTTLGSTVSEEGLAIGQAFVVAAKGLGFLAFIFIMMKYVLPRLTDRLADSQEMLILFAIAWAVFLGAVGDGLGFSKEVGAFLGGVSLASTKYRESIGARLTTLRDFLILFFFIDLGALLDWSTVGTQIGKSLIFSLFVLIGNPLIVLAIMGFMGYRRRTSFMAGLTVAQISEFSLIVTALGVTLGHVTQETVGLVTLVGVVTIFASTYMILYSGPLYEFLEAPLKIFERRNAFREGIVDTLQTAPSADMVLVGLGSFGRSLAENLLRRRQLFIAVDFDPRVFEKWRSRGVAVLYGDIADPDIHEHLPLNRVRWVVSTVRSRSLSLTIVQHLRSTGYTGKVALTAKDREEADLFKNAGADLVLKPFADAAEQAADALTHAIEFLPHDIHWPISFLEVRIRSDASAAGKTLKEISLQAMTGASILAIGRAGRFFYDAGPDFRIYPGDRLVIVGFPEHLKEAEALLNRFDLQKDAEVRRSFEITEIKVPEGFRFAGRTLAEIGFRQKYGVTVVGIRRGEEQITSVNPEERILGGDGLIVIGPSRQFETLKKDDFLA